MAVALLVSQPAVGFDTVQVTVFLKVTPWDPFTKSNFKVYINGSSSPFGVELSVNVSKPLVIQVPRGSFIWIAGEPEMIGDYGFWYRLDNVNGSGRSIWLKADGDVVIYLNYSTNHVLLSPYFITVYILLALLAVRRYLMKRFKKALHRPISE